jgi:2-polyprenyl-3-methyl-5-hydroxy-6-metoxy-1,4-benzoquinol methylase
MKTSVSTNRHTDVLLDHVPCAVCGADDPVVLFRPYQSPGPVVRCRRCGLIYVTPREDKHALIYEGPVLDNLPASILKSKSLEDVTKCWEFSMLPSKETEWPALQLNANQALDQIARFAQHPGRLLDFGCGWGFFLAVAKDRGWEPYGLEPLPGHSVYARAKFGIPVVTNTLREDTFPEGFFDIITAFQVFEHLPNPSTELTKIRHFLKPGGLVLIEVPNIETWGVRLLGKHHRHFTQDHLYFFSPSTLDALVRSRGFRPIVTSFPTRYMTVGHLISFWGKRILSPKLSHVLEALFKQAGLVQKVVSLNFGDIVSIVARKC